MNRDGSATEEKSLDKMCDGIAKSAEHSTAMEWHGTSVIGDGKATQGMNCDVKRRICEDGRIAEQ